MIEVTKGFECSRIRCVCPEHGFQRQVVTKAASQPRDVFGFPMVYRNFCACGRVCREEQVKED